MTNTKAEGSNPGLGPKMISGIWPQNDFRNLAPKRRPLMDRTTGDDDAIVAAVVWNVLRHRLTANAGPKQNVEKTRV